jgi:pyruvate/2-oxoglutarate dehydrogenase complex dihydrolipoamide acyltransferase (E2) component
MPVWTMDVENISETSAQDLGGMSLKPGQREEIEVSLTHMIAIDSNVNIKVHTLDGPYDASQVDGPEDLEAVLARRREIAEYQAAVAEENNEKVYEGRAYQNAAAKATQLGVNLDDVELVDSLEGRWTLQDVVRYVANNNDSPHEGVIEGGARTTEREGDVLISGHVANYRPGRAFPEPVQDGEGKPAQEGHTWNGITANSEGMPAREITEPMQAKGTQDEHKALGPGEEAHSESDPYFGLDYTHPEGDQETRHWVKGVPEEGWGESEGEKFAASVSAVDTSSETPGRDAAGSPAGQNEPVPNATPPAVERANELGVDLSEVEGTGQDGAILKKDVETHHKDSSAESSSSASREAQEG